VLEAFAWTETPAVLKKMEAGGHFGKLVVSVQ
jgi:hypothetical protein